MAGTNDDEGRAARERRREAAWKQAPSREVTSDEGTNIEEDPEHVRHETPIEDPDRAPPGGNPQPQPGVPGAGMPARK